MKFTDLNHEIKKLECKLYHFLNQSIYFRWGKENAQKRLDNLKKDPKCLNNIMIKTSNGKRKISSTSVRNISQYLLYQKSNVIKINT